MIQIKENLKQSGLRAARRMKDGFSVFWGDQRGDLVGSLGWMAITALLLVAVSTVLNGKMTGLAERIFEKLESLLV